MLKPHAFTTCKKKKKKKKSVQIFTTECVLISLSLAQSYLSDVEVQSRLSEHTSFGRCQARVGDIERGQW